MANVIARRIYDFMKDHLPFSLVDAATLQRVAERVVVQYRRPGEVIFRPGDQPGQFIYLIREGAVHLLQVSPEGEELLIDQHGEGEVFGIRPLLADDQYTLLARADEETLLYAVNIEGFERILSENPRLSFYLAGLMAATTRKQQAPERRNFFLLPPRADELESYQLLELQSVERAKPPVVCPPGHSVQEAAQVMSDENVGSIIVVNEKNWPLGILTDRDLRRHIATGLYPLDTPIGELMTRPVITLRPEVTVADVQIAMIRYDIHHLCLTADGTARSPVMGVVSEHDLLVLQGNNPAVLIREIGRANRSAYLRDLRSRAESLLRQYLENQVAIAYITTVMTEINDAIIQRSIELSLQEMEELGLGQPPAAFCWLALGSEGRGEQLLRTDQDNALVFADVPEEDYNSVKDFFMELARRTTEKLHVVGFAYCPGEMMASNPRWCMNLSRWKDQFSRWIAEPVNEAVLHSTIFFDYRAIFGREELADELSAHIFDRLGDQPMFLSFLARDALQNPPPLTFFRNFVVDRSGEHKDEFDIKKRAMMPLTDAARVLILSERVSRIHNTFRRFDKMAELDPNNAVLYRDASDAFEVLLRLRALQGLRRGDSGRYLRPDELSQVERLLLRNAFQPVKELQTLLNVRFQLAFLR